MKTPEDKIWALVSKIDKAFEKDDISSAPRKVLEGLIINLAEGLNDFIEDYKSASWWSEEN